MKKLILFMFLMVFSFSFSQKKIENISGIKTLELVVKEKSFYNNKSENKVYKLKYIVPNIMKKEMMEPESHKGEIFIYKDGIKKTYLPIFDEVLEDEKAPEENFVVETISLLQEKDKEDKKFRKLYNSGKDIQIRNKNITIRLGNLKLIKNYYIPTNIEIYDNDELAGKLIILDAKVNKKIDEKEFEI